MSALSKFSTTKRPRWAAAIGGTVGGAVAGSRLGVGGRAVSMVRGPIDTGGSGAGVGAAGVEGSTVTETAGGTGGVSVGGAAQPASTHDTTTAAMKLSGRRGIGRL